MPAASAQQKDVLVQDFCLFLRIAAVEVNALRGEVIPRIFIGMLDHLILTSCDYDRLVLEQLIQ